MKKKVIPHNTDKDGNANTLKANYYKMGGGQTSWDIPTMGLRRLA